MSRTHTADGRRRSSMTHARRTFRCTCGKVVAGNGGKAGHRKACDGRYLGYTERYEQYEIRRPDRETEPNDYQNADHE